MFAVVLKNNLRSCHTQIGLDFSSRTDISTRSTGNVKEIKNLAEFESRYQLFGLDVSRSCGINIC